MLKSGKPRLFCNKKVGQQRYAVCYYAPLGSLANNLHNTGHLFISYPKPMEKRRWLWPACRAEAHCLSSEDKVLMWMLYECECWMWKRIDPSVKHYLKQNELSNRKYED